MRASKKAKRHNLYMLRCEHKLTQAEFAARIGVTGRCYQNIEHGKRDGTGSFWAAVQREFDVKDEDMYKLMKLEKQVEECE